MPILTRTQILDAEDIGFQEVEVPDWGGVVRLRTLTGEEAVKFAETTKDKPGESSALLLSLVCVDEDGERIFTPADITALTRKSMRPILLLQKVAMQMNGLAEEEVKKTKND